MTGLVHRIPALSDNYIWLFEYAPGLGAVVDPAQAAPVLSKAQELGVKVTHILNTHWHPDHVGGNAEIKAQTHCQIIGPRQEAEKIPALDLAVDEGDVVTLGDVKGDVLFVGAHTAGHIAYHFGDQGVLFPGDTLFAMGCGRLFEGTAEQMFEAMRKLKALPAETDVYCAHEYTLSNAKFAVTVEPENEKLHARYRAVQLMRDNLQPTVPFKLADELETNPFLRAKDSTELAERRRAKDAF